MRYVIVGGVAAGASCAARLRRLDETAEILLLEKGPHISYANCGLPYYIGGEIRDKDALLVQTPQSFSARFAVDVRTGHEVSAVDTGAKTLMVYNAGEGSSYTLPYDKLVLAPGARPVLPPLNGIEQPGIYTLRTLEDCFAIAEKLDTTNVQSAVVVGGGYIGLEMAHNLSARGVAVTLVEAAGHVLASVLDAEMATSVEQYLRSMGVKLVLGSPVSGFSAAGSGLMVHSAAGSFGADMVLLGIGVRPDTDFLQGSGITLTQKGAIVVDTQLRTSAPDVYAAGDAMEVAQLVTKAPAVIPLAGPANKQGRIVADNLCGKPTQYKGTQGSAIAKVFALSVASTGITEATAKAADIPYNKVYITAGSHASYYPGGASINIKLLFETPGGRILGAQLIGFDGVDKRCDVLATAIRAGLTTYDLCELELCYAPPYSSAKDPVNMAGYAACNVLDGLVKQVFWQDLKKLPQDGSVTLLDVRTPRETAAHSLPGALQIPLDELRGRLAELDIAKPVYVTCKSGLRSYLACRILTQHGFDAYNFAGGFGLYQSLIQAGS